MSKEAMKLALEAVKKVLIAHPEYTFTIKPVIKTLEEALAKQEQGEPVGYLEIDDIESQREYPHNCRNVNLWYERGEGLSPVYTTPQQRTWVGLTDEEREQVYKIWRFHPSNETNLHLCKAIEAKLKEKNT